jgi:cytochrome c biogenesis protein CcmG/thiol:disulfide interchange protein DsbE
MSGSGDAAERPAARARPGLLYLLPVTIFVLLAGLFLYALNSGDPSRVPSALVGKPAPEFSLAPVEGLTTGGAPVPGFSRADLARGEVSLVNVWASWCTPCLAEHPLLMRLKRSGAVRIYGLNYKDAPHAARAFINRHGNPFDAVGADANGLAAINWGVYKVPETFVVDGAGRIVFKLVGPLDETNLREEVMPAIEAARAVSRR